MAMKHHPSLFYFSAKTGRVSRLFVAFLAICLCAMFIAGCGAKSNAGGPDTGAPQAMPVQVLIAQPQQIASSSEYLAILKSRHSATINPQVEGQVTKTFVKSGDHAKAGDPLLQIDPLKQEATVSSQEATRAAQEANVRFAKISLERAQKLYDAGVIPKQDFDNAQTSYEAAVAQLKSLEHQVQQQNVELHYYRVRAPMDGIVGDIPVRVGDRVTFTTVLTTVDEPGSLEAYIYVPASRAKDLRTGLPVKLMDENGTALADTQVTFVSPQVDSETQTVLAKASIGNRKAGFRISQQVRAQITWGTREGQVIPVLAVQRINGEFFAFAAVKEGKATVARQRLLKLGEIVGNDYTILEGLNSGDHIIVSGLQFLQDGAPVTEQIQAPKAANGQDAATEVKRP
jgi:RND family efflux transporter MFP subunit